MSLGTVALAAVNAAVSFDKLNDAAQTGAVIGIVL